MNICLLADLAGQDELTPLKKLLTSYPARCAGGPPGVGADLNVEYAVPIGEDGG